MRVNRLKNHLTYQGVRNFFFTFVQGVFIELAQQMGFHPVVLAHTAPPAIKASFSSVPGGLPSRETSAQTQQNNNPFNVMTIPITGSHPLQNFARFQTVHVVPAGSEGQYNFNTPPMNSIVVNTGDTEWLSSITAASGFLAEGYEFKVGVGVLGLWPEHFSTLLWS